MEEYKNFEQMKNQLPKRVEEKQKKLGVIKMMMSVMGLNKMIPPTISGKYSQPDKQDQISDLAIAIDALGKDKCAIVVAAIAQSCKINDINDISTNLDILQQEYIAYAGDHPEEFRPSVDDFMDDFKNNL